MSEATATTSAWSVIRRFVPYGRKHRWLLAGSTAAMLAEVGFRLLEPWPLKFVFDRMTLTPEPGAAPPAIDTPTLLGICAAAVVVLVGFRAFRSYLRRVGFALAGNMVLTECRADLFSHLQRLSLSFHSRRRTGDLTTRLTSDIGRLQEIVSTAVLPLAAHALTVIAIAVVMLWLEWRLALIAFAVLPLFYYSTKRLGREIRTTARRERERHADIGSVATEAMGSIRVVQSLGAESKHGKRFEQGNAGSLREGVRGKRLNARLLGTADIFIALGTALVLFFGAKFAIEGSMTVGDLVVFLAYHKNMTRPIRNIAKYSGRTAKALASAERVVEILDQAPTIAEAPDAVEAPAQIASVTFDGVSFGYEPGARPALESITLTAKRGRVIALVGRSGAGKSTLMNLLLRLYDPTEGQILADGLPVSGFRIKSWRQRIAVVPQGNTLFQGTVRENIAFGSEAVSDERVEEAARLVGAHGFISELAEGYDTVLGERGEGLSEGQRQRVAIARAAAKDAPVLVFDEPTANLDTENTQRVWDAIRTLSRERICFVISHDPRTMADADELVILRKGRVVEQGTHERLASENGHYASLLGRMQQPAAAGVADV